jgi:hypothetical protein
MSLITPHAIDAKSEGFLLHALQTASLNLRRTDLESIIREPVVIGPSTTDVIPPDEYRREAEGFEDEDDDEEADDEDDDEDENEETDDEDEEDEDEEEEPPMYVEGVKLHSAVVAASISA